MSTRQPDRTLPRLAGRPLIGLLLVAGTALAAAPPPEPLESRRDAIDSAPAGAIFTYTVDGRCRIAMTRKLKGPDWVTWGDAARHHALFAETTVWRYIGGTRRQLRERRVRLLGEMVSEALLLCLVQPSGQVVEAWIERPDANRRAVPVREPLEVRNDTIEDLGTFSVHLLDRDLRTNI